MVHRRNTVVVVVLTGFVALWGGCARPYAASSLPAQAHAANRITILTWNVRGYPEKRQSDRQWFTSVLDRLDPDVLCVQEIANQAKVNTFQAQENHFTSVAFRDSNDSQDNAILAGERIALEDLPDPGDFLHPAQVAYIASEGFDAVVITVHFPWTDLTRREKEKVLLKDLVAAALTKDPDVIVCGDFNTTEPGIDDLAEALGLIVMVPAGQDGVGTTYAGNRYDWFLISPDLAREEAVSCRIVTFPDPDLPTAKSVSDHRPVEAVFRTDPAFRDRN